MEGKPHGRQQVQLRFDGRDRRQVRTASLVHALDVWDQVELVDQPSEERMELVTRTGEVLAGYSLFRHLVRSLRLLWPIALLTWLPGFAALGRRWYPARIRPAKGN